MKKLLIGWACILLFGVLGLILTSCMGNTGNITEGMTNATNTFNYVLTNEAGVYHLHEVNRWKDSESSDALGITTKCCNNQFWTSYNTSVLYTNKPEYLPEGVIVCKEATDDE